MDLLKHNQDTYHEILLKLNSNNRVGVVQCTGSGKGVIATKLIEVAFYNYRILVLAPQEAILTHYLSTLGIRNSDRVRMATYQEMVRKSVEELEKLAETYDILILDEYHRCGAKKWGKAVEILIDVIDGRNNGKVIGFTATPKRYLDNGRDMTEELFGGVVVEGVDLTAAIKKGILPTFTYVKARYGYTSEINGYLKQGDGEKLKKFVNPNRLAMLEHNDEYIKDIIKRETEGLGKNQKWVVFCSSIKELEDVFNHIDCWFTVPIKKAMIHSDQAKELNNKILLDFINVTHGMNVLLVVNKLNEGVHVKDINGVMMIRPTKSPIIFLQQLGRALSVGQKCKPIIFDFVNNIDDIQHYEDIMLLDLFDMADEVNSYMERREKKGKNGGKIVIKSYCEDIDKILADVRKVVGRRWTEEEDNIIKEYWSSEGKDVANRLPGRNRDAVYQRARNLGLVGNRSEWTRMEDNIIRKYYPIEGSGVVIRLKNRTEIAVKGRASKLGVKLDKSKCWKEEDDNILRRKYRNTKYPIANTIRLLDGRFTTEQIYQRLKYLGFNYTSMERWTSDEDGYLRLVWGHVPMEEIEKRLVRHTRQAIDREASYLGLEKSNPKKKGGSDAQDLWREEDKLALIELYNEMGKDCIPLFAPRTYRAVEQQITNLRKDIRYKDLFTRDREKGGRKKESDI